MTDFAKEQASLVAFLHDEDARDTASWVTGFLRTFYGTFLSLVGPTELAAAFEHGVEHADDCPELSCFTCGLATLMAATEEARLGGDVRRTMDLLDCSFLQFNEFRDRLRQVGLDLSPFPYKTTEQRRDQLRFAVEQLRSSFTHDDWRVLSEARATDTR